MTNFRALCAELLAALEIQLDELRFNNRLCLRARAALAHEVEQYAQDRDDLALRVQRLEALRETERAAVLDLYQQIDRLKQRIDWQYTKIGRLENAITSETEAQP